MSSTIAITSKARTQDGRYTILCWHTITYRGLEYATMMSTSTSELKNTRPFFGCLASHISMKTRQSSSAEVIELHYTADTVIRQQDCQ